MILCGYVRFGKKYQLALPLHAGTQLNHPTHFSHADTPIYYLIKNTHTSTNRIIKLWITHTGTSIFCF